MSRLLNKIWIVLAVTLALPFTLLAMTYLAGVSGGGRDAAFLLLILCIVSIYTSFITGILALGSGLVFWLLGVWNPRRGKLLLLVSLTCINIVASVLWMRTFVRHIRLAH